MGKKLIGYSLPIFILFMVFTLIGIAINYKHNGPVNSISIFEVCTGLMLVISLILGSATYYRFEVWLPKTRKSLLTKKPFKGLLENEFEENDGRVSKIIEGYNVSVSFQIEPRMILVEVMFNPVNNGVNHTKDELYRLIKPYDKTTWYRGKAFLWGKGILINQISCTFKMPDYETVDQKINQCVKILQEIGAKP